MDDATIEAEIDVRFEKMRQGLADTKRQRAESVAQWESIGATRAETAALCEETRQLLMKLELGP